MLKVCPAKAKVVKCVCFKIGLDKHGIFGSVKSYVEFYVAHNLVYSPGFSNCGLTGSTVQYYYIFFSGLYSIGTTVVCGLIALRRARSLQKQRRRVYVNCRTGR